ncbi:serine/threonine-protein kinase psk1 [Niveomyces insectorum RCEF 264]|uniref:Serine/threonine-protein kinase psk1 n=1 Tax=Niveomyces insectorum RCEF 264 TaxID=1081102 RepID=A0A167U582_9HYPO|nr:serine/threonine-protein kinase psk1 [Niveomyces insectorum RCEF 264]
MSSTSSMPLHTTWAVRAAAGEPPAVVRVRDLQTVLSGAVAPDAWGRTADAGADGDRGAQPLLISAEVCLTRPFTAAYAEDRVAADTVHYGHLSRALLQSVRRWSSSGDEGQQAKVDGKDATPPCLRDVLDGIWVDLTGVRVDGTAEPTTKEEEEEEKNNSQPPGPAPPSPLLAPKHVRALSVTLRLPKGTRNGAGVSMTATSLLGAHPACAAVTLRLHDLHVPTLVGVHPHERAAKQMVVADVAIDRYDVRGDAHTALETLVERTLTTSSFQTLEALATEVAETVLAEFRVRPHPMRPGDTTSGVGVPPWQVHVAVAKPVAVPFAAAPVVEVRLDGHAM